MAVSEAIKTVQSAIRSNDSETLKSCLAANPELASARDDNGNSPLQSAIYFGRTAMVDFILGLGVQPDIFESAAGGLTAECRRLLLASPGLVRERSHDGWTALHLAAFFGHLELATMLLDQGASMLAISNNNESNLPINAAAAGGRNAIVRLFVERGCPPDARASENGYTALHLAANSGNTELIAFLLESGADRNLGTGSGETSYDLAMKRGYTAASHMLAPASQAPAS